MSDYSLKQFWHVVPKDDGYHVLGKKDGKLVLVHKAHDDKNTYELKFNTEQLAKQYINDKNLSTKFMPEAYLSRAEE